MILIAFLCLSLFNDLFCVILLQASRSSPSYHRPRRRLRHLRRHQATVVVVVVKLQPTSGRQQRQSSSRWSPAVSPWRALPDGCSAREQRFLVFSLKFILLTIF
jgi:hypothetical protein